MRPTFGLAFLWCVRANLAAPKEIILWEGMASGNEPAKKSEHDAKIYSTIVCFFIQTYGNNTSNCVEIPGGKGYPSGLHKAVSQCWVSNPCTLPRDSFIKKIGYVQIAQQKKINFAVQEFCQIVP